MFTLNLTEPGPGWDQNIDRFGQEKEEDDEEEAAMCVHNGITLVRNVDSDDFVYTQIKWKKNFNKDDLHNDFPPIQSFNQISHIF